jgi:hypothetical protein
MFGFNRGKKTSKGSNQNNPNNQNVQTFGEDYLGQTQNVNPSFNDVPAGFQTSPMDSNFGLPIEMNQTNQGGEPAFLGSNQAQNSSTTNNIYPSQENPQNFSNSDPLEGVINQTQFQQNDNYPKFSNENLPLNRGENSQSSTIYPNSNSHPELVSGSNQAQTQINPNQFSSSPLLDSSINQSSSGNDQSQRNFQQNFNYQGGVQNPQSQTANQTQDPQVLIASLSDDDKELIDFLNTLVAAMTGYAIVDIKEDQRENTVSECVRIFSDFVINYVKAKYGDKEGMRLKSAQMYEGVNVFEKFNELGPLFDEAYDAFLNSLDGIWDKKAQDLVANPQNFSNSDPLEETPKIKDFDPLEGVESPQPSLRKGEQVQSSYNNQFSSPQSTFNPNQNQF